MGVVIKDLREPVQPVAKYFISRGFSMTDLISVGLTFLEGKESNEISEIIASWNEVTSAEKEAAGIVDAAEADALAQKQNRHRKKPKSA